MSFSGGQRRGTPARQDRRNSARLAHTTVAPTGVEQAKDTVSPAQKHTTEAAAAHSVTASF